MFPLHITFCFFQFNFFQFVFGRDLKLCPTFSKLKNLLLDDHWCVAPDFSALNCILKHSPVLEKLTLQLFSEVDIQLNGYLLSWWSDFIQQWLIWVKCFFLLQGPQHKIEMIAILTSMDRSVAVSEHLKAIEIKCEVVGEEVHKVLKFYVHLIYVS